MVWVLEKEAVESPALVTVIIQLKVLLALTTLSVLFVLAMVRSGLLDTTTPPVMVNVALAPDEHESSL